MKPSVLDCNYRQIENLGQVLNMTAPCDQPAQSLTMFRDVRMFQYTNVIGQTVKLSKVAFERSRGDI